MIICVFTYLKTFYLNSDYHWIFPGAWNWSKNYHSAYICNHKITISIANGKINTMKCTQRGYWTASSTNANLPTLFEFKYSFYEKYVRFSFHINCFHGTLIDISVNCKPLIHTQWSGQLIIPTFEIYVP